MAAWRCVIFALVVQSIVGVTAAFLVQLSSALPINKAVVLFHELQNAAEEGENAEVLHQTFSGSAAESKIQAASAQKLILNADARDHQVNAHASKANRKKELATYNNHLGDTRQNFAAIRAAAEALEQGMVRMLLQSSFAGKLLFLLSDKQDMTVAHRKEILAALSTDRSSENAPANSELAGILKGMADEMAADQKGFVDKEQDAVKVYTGLMAARQKEIAALLQHGIEPSPLRGMENAEAPSTKGKTCFLCGFLVTLLFVVLALGLTTCGAY